jgi:hypothetical protein
LNKRDYLHAFSPCCIWVFLLFSLVSAAEETFPELEKEIADLQKKIETTIDNVKQVNKKIEADTKAFEKYTEQHTTHYQKQQAELDALKNDYKGLHLRADSLARRIQEIKGKQHELDLMQDKFRWMLVQSCEELERALLLLPPGTAREQISALKFLHSELSVQAVDNVEALERFWQVLTTLSESSQSIDVFSGQSPVPFITGQVDFIRLGFVYLAVVNEKGTSGALWVPLADSAGGAWIESLNPQQLLALKKCVTIRQGSTVPEIVSIPFKHPIFDDSREKKGGDE